VVVARREVISALAPMINSRNVLVLVVGVGVEPVLTVRVHPAPLPVVELVGRAAAVPVVTDRKPTVLQSLTRAIPELPDRLQVRAAEVAEPVQQVPQLQALPVLAEEGEADQVRLPVHRATPAIPEARETRPLQIAFLYRRVVIQ